MRLVLPAFASVPSAGSETTVYPVIGLLPSYAEASNVTVASPSPATATTLVGARGGTGATRTEITELLGMPFTNTVNRRYPSGNPLRSVAE